MTMTSVNEVISLEAVQNIRAIAAKKLVLPGGTEDVLIVCVTCPFETSNLAIFSNVVLLLVLKNFDCLVAVIIRIEIFEFLKLDRDRWGCTSLSSPV